MVAYSLPNLRHLWLDMTTVPNIVGDSERIDLSPSFRFGGL